MSKASEPFKNIWREEGKKHPEGGKTFIEAVNKRHDELKQQAAKEKKLCSHSNRASRFFFWSGVESHEEMEKLCQEALRDYKHGDFFLERMGRYRAVDVKLSLTLNFLRQQWIAEYEVKTVPEFILLDMALTSFFHFLRLNEAVNNIMANIEWQMFELDAPNFLIWDKWGERRPYGEKDDKAVAETLAYRLKDVLLPALEQYNRSFIRNLKAIRDLKRGNIQLNIGNVGQVNIGDKQMNIENPLQNN